MLATAAVAQVNTNKLPEIPPPATAVTLTAPVVAPLEIKTNAPVKKAVAAKSKPRKKVAAKAPAAALEKNPPSSRSRWCPVRRPSRWII